MHPFVLPHGPFTFEPIRAYHPSFSDLVNMLNLKSYLQTNLLNQQLCQLQKPVPVPMYMNSNLPSQNFNLNFNIQSNYNQEINPLNVLPGDPDICLEAQIKYMVQFFINNYGIVRMKDIKEERRRYSYSAVLTKVFDTLATKYSMTTKTREELIKWIIRRVLMTSKQNIKGNKKISQKKLSNIVSQRYFKANKSSPGSQDEVEGHEDWNESLHDMKPSKNKTINMNFIEEIFGSEEFQQDYDSFIRQFDDIIEKDTKEKMGRFLNFILECVKDDTIGEIMKYKRVPWLKSWVEKACKIALELEDRNLEKKSWKKVKVDESSDECSIWEKIE